MGPAPSHHRVARVRTRRSLDPAPRAVMPPTDTSVPRIVAVGYAECRWSSFDECQWLCCETLPSELCPATQTFHMVEQLAAARMEGEGSESLRFDQPRSSLCTTTAYCLCLTPAIVAF